MRLGFCKLLSRRAESSFPIRKPFFFRPMQPSLVRYGTQAMSQRKFESTKEYEERREIDNKYIESASKTRSLGIIKRRLGSIKRNYRTTRVENK
jgi:hypothetical protein